MKNPSLVIPVKTGIHVELKFKKPKMDSRFHGNDERLVTLCSNYKENGLI